MYVLSALPNKIDPFLDTTLFEHTPLTSEFDALDFTGEWLEWGFLRSFAAKNALTSGAKLTKRKHVLTPPLAAPPPSSQSHTPSYVSLNSLNGTSMPPGPCLCASSVHPPPLIVRPRHLQRQSHRSYQSCTNVYVPDSPRHGSTCSKAMWGRVSGHTRMIGLACWTRHVSHGNHERSTLTLQPPRAQAQGPSAHGVCCPQRW
ncbi:hypothetical protein JB92DRAFT_3099603 [Gautieria morchelliformis]|nr:hypothetical protein JB92DRAFT_3099603 [Gautieria morchelliformis]